MNNQNASYRDSNDDDDEWVEASNFDDDDCEPLALAIPLCAFMPERQTIH